MKPKKHRNFDALQDKWYAKLEKEGFKDIEQDENHLVRWDTGRYKHQNLSNIKSTQDYYIMAEHFLYEYKFKNDFEKVIWEYHSNGLSIRDIIKILKAVKVKRATRTIIWSTIKKIRTEMKLHYGVNTHGKSVN